MLGLGRDPGVVDEEGTFEALDRIEQATNDGQIRAFTGNEYLRSLESGDFVACIAWSGDVVQLQYTRPDIQFVIPDEGGMSWYDTMVIPKGAPNAFAAADWSRLPSNSRSEDATHSSMRSCSRSTSMPSFRKISRCGLFRAAA